MNGEPVAVFGGGLTVEETVFLTLGLRAAHKATHRCSQPILMFSTFSRGGDVDFNSLLSSYYILPICMLLSQGLGSEERDMVSHQNCAISKACKS